MKIEAHLNSDNNVTLDISSESSFEQTLLDIVKNASVEPYFSHSVSGSASALLGPGEYKTHASLVFVNQKPLRELIGEISESNLHFTHRQ